MKIHLKVHRGKGKRLSRKGTLTDKAIQFTKRKEAEKERDHVQIEGKRIENVYNFVYLGCKTQADGDCMADIKFRLDLAQVAFNDLSKLWADSNLPLTMKLGLYSTAVCSSLSHGSEAWEFTQAAQGFLNGFNCRCLFWITGKQYRETATNPDYDLFLAIRKRRLRYLGHILRMSNDCLVRRTFIAYISYPDGPPNGSLLDDCLSRSINELTSLAVDRVKWRKLAKSLS